MEVDSFVELTMLCWIVWVTKVDSFVLEWRLMNSKIELLGCVGSFL